MRAVLEWLGLDRPALSTAERTPTAGPVAERTPTAGPVAERTPTADPVAERTPAEAAREPVPVAKEGSSEPALRQGELLDLATSAPHVGRLRPAPTPTLGSEITLRTPTVVSDGLRCGGFQLAAASHAGAQHLHRGTPRQDAYDFVAAQDGRLIVAIADGLGSRPCPQLGARLFGEFVVQLAVRDPGGTAAHYLIAAAELAGRSAENHHGVTRRDIGFVAAVAVFDEQLCTIARVGDVSACAENGDEPFHELFTDDGESMNEVAEALPGPATPEVRTTGSARVVLTTDGMAGDIRYSPTVRTWLADRWSAPLTAHAMSDTLRFRRQGSHDDRTAVVVWRGARGETR